MTRFRFCTHLLSYTCTCCSRIHILLLSYSCFHYSTDKLSYKWRVWLCIGHSNTCLHVCSCCHHHTWRRHDLTTCWCCCLNYTTGRKKNTTEIFMCGYRYFWILIDQICNAPWWQFFTPVNFFFLSSSNWCQLSLVCFLRSETRRRAKQIWPDTNWIFRWRLRQSSKSVYALGAVFIRCKPACQQWRIYHVSSSTLNVYYERIIRNSSLKTDHSWLYSYLTGISWLVLILSITCSLAALLYNAVSGFDWTATTVVRFAWKAVVGRSHARAARAPIIFGYQVVVTARNIIVVGPLTVVVAVTLLNKETIVTNIRLYSSFRLPSLRILKHC